MTSVSFDISTDGTLDASFGPFCTTHSAAPRPSGCSGLFDVPGEVVTDVASGPTRSFPTMRWISRCRPTDTSSSSAGAGETSSRNSALPGTRPNGALVVRGVLGRRRHRRRSPIRRRPIRWQGARRGSRCRHHDRVHGAASRGSAQDMVVGPRTFGSGGTALVSGPRTRSLTSMAIRPERPDRRRRPLWGRPRGCIARLDVRREPRRVVRHRRPGQRLPEPRRPPRRGRRERRQDRRRGQLRRDLRDVRQGRFDGGRLARPVRSATAPGSRSTGAHGRGVRRCRRKAMVRRPPRVVTLVGGLLRLGQPDQPRLLPRPFPDLRRGGLRRIGLAPVPLRRRRTAGLNARRVDAHDRQRRGPDPSVHDVKSPSTVALDSPASPAVADGVVYIGSTDSTPPPSTRRASQAARAARVSVRRCGPRRRAASSPPSAAVVDGTAYVQSQDGNLYAFDAAGVSGCVGVPKVCAPLWTASTGSVSSSSPTVANGVVYIGSSNGDLYVFDAAGASGCAGMPKDCSPLWTAPAGGDLVSSPAVADGDRLHRLERAGTGRYVHRRVPLRLRCGRRLRLFRHSDLSVCHSGGAYRADEAPRRRPRTAPSTSARPSAARPRSRVAAFDAASGDGLWSTSVAGSVNSSPAVADGVVYVGAQNGTLYAFDTARQSLWSGPSCCTASGSSPAVAGGVVFVAGGDGTVSAFDAAGIAGCSGSPTVVHAALGRAARDRQFHGFVAGGGRPRRLHRLGARAALCPTRFRPALRP